jgi:hypothetical protein
VEVGGIPKHAERACSDQFVLAVAAAEQPDAEHSGPAGSHQVPHGITHHVAVLHFHTQALLAFQEQVRLGLGPRQVPTLHDDGVLGQPQGFQRGVDVGLLVGSGDAVDYFLLAQEP